MSSDSEDFQSADEGSDEDDGSNDDFKESKQTKSIVQNNDINVNQDRKSSKIASSENMVSLEESPEKMKLECKISDQEPMQQSDKSQSKVTDEPIHFEGTIPESTNFVLSSGPETTEKKKIDKEKNASKDKSPKKLDAKQTEANLKKPRERLGEKLGAKKLGVRQTKPLVGISHDSFQNSEKSSHRSSPTTPEDEDKLQRQKQWEEQQAHWANANDKESSDGWSSWGGWGSSLLTAATTITREVGKGVGNVLETVEGSLGVPDPSVLAEESIKNEKDALKKEPLLVEEDSSKTSLIQDSELTSEKHSNFVFPSFGGLSSLVEGVSGAIESASNKVLLGSLDTLEMIGKKTMDVLQEGDPRLENKRAFLMQGRPSLSKILEEAKQQNAANEGISTSPEREMKHVSFFQIWDATEGPAHMEAISLVAKQCQARTASLSQALPPNMSDKCQQAAAKIKAYSELQSDQSMEDVSQELDNICNDIPLTLNFAKLILSWNSLQSFVSHLHENSKPYDSKDVELFIIERDLYTAAAGFMIQVVAILHKAAEVSLVSQDLEVIDVASQFQRLCGCISQGFEKVADDICERVSAQENDHSATDAFVTNVYLQMAEGNDLLQQSLKHLSHIFTQIKTKEFS